MTRAQGRALRDAGEQQVLHFETDFKSVYRAMAQAWFDALPYGATFTGEIMRLVMQAMRIPEPGHPNAWGAMAGAMLRHWMKAERVHVVGLLQAVTPRSHAHYYRQYMKAK